MDELIVNGENVLHPADFHRNKDELSILRNGISTDSSLPYFKEKNLIWNANVKGEDMNSFVSSLQGKLTTIHNTEIGLTNFIDAFINTFESLDRGYLQGICIAIKAGQEADAQANYALEKIRDTLEKLELFRDKLKRNTKHLNDIDDMWNDIQDALDKCIEIEKALKKESELVRSTSTELQKSQNALKKIKHLMDVDGMYADISMLKVWENTIYTDLKAIKSTVTSLNAYKTKLETIQHLYSIDELFDGHEMLQSDYTGFKSAVNDALQIGEKNIKDLHEGLKETKTAVLENSHEIDRINVNLSHLSEREQETADDIAGIYVNLKQLIEYKQELEEIQHLNDLDMLYSESEATQNAFISFKSEINESLQGQKTDIAGLQEVTERLNASIAENTSNTSTEIDALKRKLNTMYILLGGTAGIVVLQLILNIMGIL